MSLLNMHGTPVVNSPLRAAGGGRCAWPRVLALVLAASCGFTVLPDVRVQDLARLQGERTNKLMGYGLVVGLRGTGDGDKSRPTIRALMALHQRYQTPVLAETDLKGNASVALVAVEVEIPPHGAREGQALDVTVSAVGTAKSLEGGQLLTTPLQFAMFDEREPATQTIFALAGGRIELTDRKNPTRGRVRRGATLEADFFYSFIEDDAITLVLDEAHTAWTWAQMVARAINHELSATAAAPHSAAGERRMPAEPALALSPGTVRVKIPPYEMAQPASYISRVLQTPLFVLPEQDARVVINRTTRSIAFTGAVRLSPAILQIPAAGTIAIGMPEPAEGQRPDGGPESGVARRPAGVEFRELLANLSAIKVPPEQMIDAIEHLHKTGALHARLQYEE